MGTPSLTIPSSAGEVVGRAIVSIRAVIFSLFAIASLSLPSAGDCTATVSGVVRDSDGPVAGAIVRIQTTAFSATTDEKGRFLISGLLAGKEVRVTAAADGYYIGGGEPVKTPALDLSITLKRFGAADHEEYEWVAAHSGEVGEGHCAECHSFPETDGGTLPFEEWLDDAHSHSAINHRFSTMFTGCDVHGNQSPPTRYASSRDYGRFPLRPDPEEPFFGPGYKLDFPKTNGTCAACHVPVAAIDSPHDTDPRNVTGAAREGVTCDLCHKVIDVELDPETGLPRENRHGVMSMVFRRPGPGHQLFFGPLDDVAPGEDVFSPLYRESRFCAPCHHGVFWDTVIYNSFGEWLDSPYSDAESKLAKTCQDCHMPRGSSDHFARLDKEGRRRDPAAIASHRMPGTNAELLKAAARLEVRAHRKLDTVTVDVIVVNDRTGHHLPTGSPLRQVLLEVAVTDSTGTPLDLVDGPSLPAWTADLAGRPGRAYVKVLEELWTETAPTASYWKPTRIRSDTRIEALGADRGLYVFAAMPEQPLHIEVRLLYRRAFAELAELKGWEDPDILMASHTIELN